MNVERVIKNQATLIAMMGSDISRKEWEAGLRKMVAECFGRFVDLHKDHSDPIGAMMEWIEQLRGES